MQRCTEVVVGSSSGQYVAAVEAAANMSPSRMKMDIDFLLSPEVAGESCSSTSSTLSASSAIPIPSSVLAAHATTTDANAPNATSTVVAAGRVREGSSASALLPPSHVDAVSSEQAPTREGDLLIPSARHACRCGEKFTRSIHYLYHVHEGNRGCNVVDGKLYPCDIPGCKSAFRRKTDRAKHKSCVHTKLRPFKCKDPSCDSAFFFGKDERKHYATVRKFLDRVVCAEFSRFTPYLPTDIEAL
jgi:hypothetical protein